MLEELGISLGTAVVLLIALYFVIKWGVRNGIRELFEEMEESNGTISWNVNLSSADSNENEELEDTES